MFENLFIPLFYLNVNDFFLFFPLTYSLLVFTLPVFSTHVSFSAFFHFIKLFSSTDVLLN